MKHEDVVFEDMGYYKEYYINGKFIGFAACDKDRDTFGYYGKVLETVLQDVRLQNKKVIKARTTVETWIYPMCGKLSDKDRPNFKAYQQ